MQDARRISITTAGNPTLHIFFLPIAAVCLFVFLYMTVCVVASKYCTLTEMDCVWKRSERYYTIQFSLEYSLRMDSAITRPSI